MFSLHATFSLRYHRRRWVRAVLIVASIAAGVSLLVATSALNDTMARAAQAAANPIAGSVDLIVSNGDALIDRALANELKNNVAGIADAHPRIFERVDLLDLNQRNVLLIGLDFHAEMKKTGKSDWQIDITALSEVFEGAVVGKALSQSLPSNDIKVRTPVRSEPFTLKRVGTIDAKGAAAALGGQVLLVHLPVAARLLDMKADKVTRIDLDLKPGSNRVLVQKEVTAFLAGRAEVRTPDEQNQTVLSVMASMQIMLNLCGVVALVVGLFLVYNALAVSVAERRHDIGILLAIGATRGQIRRLFVGEAALLGLAGALLGIPLGWALAWLGLGPVQDVLSDIFYAVEARQVEISGWLVLAALIAGVLTAVFASLVPAVAAARERPAEAVRRLPPQTTWTHRALQALCSVCLIVLGFVCVGLRNHLPARVGMLGGLGLVIVGGLLITPLVTALIARLLLPVARHWFRIEGRLATDNLVRSASRTGLVIAALAAGIALVMGTTGIIRSNRETLHDWIQDSFAADYFVTSGSPVGSSGRTRPMSLELGKQIEKKIAGVEATLPARLRKFVFRDTHIFLIVISAGDFYKIDSRRRAAQKRDANDAELRQYKKLADTPDGVLVSHNFRALYGIRAGDTLQLASNRGSVTLQVVGEVVDYSWNHGTLLLNREFYVQNWDDERVDVFDLYLKPGADGRKVQEDVLKEFGAEGLFVLSRAQLQGRVSAILDALYAIAYAQQIVVIIVAALGVVTSLLISIIQRRRELGLMRALGASRAQIVRSVLAEALLMGVIGTVIGLVVGVALEWYALEIVFVEETGYQFPVLIPWRESLWIAGLALLTTLLAGLGPAVHATRERIPEAIALE